MKKALQIRLELLGDNHPDSRESWKSLVHVLLKHHKKGDALALVEHDLKRFPNNSTLLHLRNEILGKRTPKAPRNTKTGQKPKPRKR